MLRPARSKDAIDHLRRFADLAAGVVTVTMKNGDQIYGAIVKTTNRNEPGGYCAGVTLLRENGQQEDLDLLDVWHIDPAETTEAMQTTLRASGRL
jgi:hypothetical protein